MTDTEPTSVRNSPKRSRMLIDPTVQWAMVGRLFIHWGLLVGCLVGINSTMSLFMMSGEQPLASAVGDAARSQLPLLLVILTLIPVFVRDTLKLSNRFAGPMYRIRTGLQQLKRSEEVAPIQLRGTDFWKPIAADFNQVAEELQALRIENEQLKAEMMDREAQVG